jgi:hypothetical protein
MSRNRRRLMSRPMECAAIECLEDRALLSGNAFVAVSPTGYLIVRLKGNGDNIAIQSTSNGQLQVSGLNGTTINGGNTPFIATGVTDAVRIVVMDGSGDVIQVGGGTTQTVLPENLVVKMNTGPNSLVVSNVSITGSFRVERGPGDAVTVSGVSVGGKTDLNVPLGTPL